MRRDAFGRGSDAGSFGRRPSLAASAVHDADIRVGAARSAEVEILIRNAHSATWNATGVGDSDDDEGDDDSGENSSFGGDIRIPNDGAG